MSAAAISFHTPVLPWAVSAADEERFRKILQRVVIACLVLGLALPWLPLPKIDRAQPVELPPRLAKLLLEREKTPPAPPAVKPKTAPEPEREVALDKAEAPKPEPVKKREAPVPEARNPQPNKPPGEALDLARRKASGVGLLAMKNELAEMHSAPLAVQLKSDIKPGPGVGIGTGPGVGAGTEPGLPTRALITSSATNGSGGINTASYSRNTGGGGLAGRSTTLVEGVAGGGGGGGYGGGGSSRC